MSEADPPPQATPPKATEAAAQPRAAPATPKETPTPAKTADAGAGDTSEEGPSLPTKDMTFVDDGKYPNLAQVPARPPNLPTFLEASNLEKSIVADRDAAKSTRPDSPQNPTVDSTPVSVAKAAPAQAAPAEPAKIVDRKEDASPCLSAQLAVEPTAVLRFELGSAALTTDDLVILADAMPTVRGSKGTIRIFGHGDTDKAAPPAQRFDLATARAGAVAQALAGYGIPTPRIAVGVACTDTSVAGASAQLYTES